MAEEEYCAIKECIFLPVCKSCTQVCCFCNDTNCQRLTLLGIPKPELELALRKVHEQLVLAVGKTGMTKTPPK